MAGLMAGSSTRHQVEHKTGHIPKLWKVSICEIVGNSRIEVSHIIKSPLTLTAVDSLQYLLNSIPKEWKRHNADRATGRGIESITVFPRGYTKWSLEH